MRFLRMRPAVCAMISCSFSSLTRKVAFGSSSVTTPGNSSSSSFAIRYPDLLIDGRDVPDIAAESGAEPSGCRAALQLHVSNIPLVPAPAGIQIRAGSPAPPGERNTRRASLVAGPTYGEALAYPVEQLVADGTVGLELLLAAAFGVGRVGRRPIFDLDRAGAGEFERPVMRLRRERDDEIEVETFQFVELFKRDRLMPRDV